MTKIKKTILLVAGGIIILITAGALGVLTFAEHDVVVVNFDNIALETIDKNPTAKDSRPTLRIAVAAMISPKVTEQYYNELLNLIGDSLGYRTVFLQRKTYDEVNKLLEHKEVDLAFVCSGPYVKGHREFGLEILVVPVVHGQKVYYSYLLAGKSGGIKSLDDLSGKRFAFTDPQSNTGCLVPRFMLSQRGKTPESFFGEHFFTHSHDNSIKAVAEGLADGAAVDSLIWEFANATDPTYTAKTIVIEKSPPYGIPPIVVHPDLNADTKRCLKELFLNLHKDSEATSLLHKLMIDRFEQGDDAMYDSVREMQHWLEQEEGQEE